MIKKGQKVIINTTAFGEVIGFVEKIEGDKVTLSPEKGKSKKHNKSTFTADISAIEEEE